MPLKFTYDNDPGNSNRDAVRWLAGDTDEHTAQIDDREIDFSLTQFTNKRLAAAMCLDAVAAKFSYKASVSIGEISRSLGDVADKLRKRAEELRSEASKHNVLPFFGGLTISGKEALSEDSNAVQPPFTMRQFDRPDAPQFDGNSGVDPED